MDKLTLLSAFHQSLWVMMVAVCAITLPTLLVGIVVSIMQAATQINEMSLTFIPKLIVMFLVLLTMLPWFLDKLVSMTQTMMYQLPNYLS